MVILISSAVRSPTSRLYLRLMNWAIASSILSPPTRTEREKAMPESEITATSVVPQPISTLMLPVGSVLGRLAHRALFHFGDAEGHADDDARPHQGAAIMNFLNEVAEHRFGDLEIRDHAVLQRPDRDDAARGAAEHAFGLRAHGQNFFAPALVSLLHRDHRRLVADDALILDVDQSVGRAEINGKVVGKDADEATPHQKTPSCARGKRLEHGENNRFTRIKQDNEKLKEKSFYPAPPGCIAPGH